LHRPVLRLAVAFTGTQLLVVSVRLVRLDRATCPLDQLHERKRPMGAKIPPAVEPDDGISERVRVHRS